MASAGIFRRSSVFLAFNISSFVPPDEVTHAGLCKIFSKVFLFPENSPATYEYGLVTNSPWLYYWIMGKLPHLNFFGISDLIFLRLLNIPLAFGTVFFVRRTLLLLTHDRIAQLLLLLVMTNTAMFSFLSASVSYDNLTNLLAAMSIFYLLAFFTYRSGTLLAAAILCQLAGSLTKVTFLPLLLVLNVLLLIHEFRRLHILPVWDSDPINVGRLPGKDCHAVPYSGARNYFQGVQRRADLIYGCACYDRGNQAFRR